MGHDRIRSGGRGTGNCWKGMRRCKYLETLGTGKTQGTISDTEHPVMITVSEHSETRDM